MGLWSNIFLVYILVQVAIIFTAISEVSTERFCNRTYSSNFTTRCTACLRNKDVECPYSATKLTTGRGMADCMYIVTLGGSKLLELAGCRHRCHRNAVLVRCCEGHWGPQCEECPGGADNVCSGHGLCSAGIDGIGTCDCDANYTGNACELCERNNFYGHDCKSECQCLFGACDSGVFGNGSCDCWSGYKGDFCDIEIEGCANITCDNNSRCQEVDGNVTCVCDHGYEDGENDTCVPINKCLSSPCHGNAFCIMTGPAEYECNCMSGYEGDGFICNPINPCQVDNGGCISLTAECIFTGPNQSKCDCMDGYQNYSPGIGCSLIDICSPTSCHVNANCTTTNPNSIHCECHEGYVGDGRECYGNIMQRIEDLNQNDEELQGRLQYAIELFNSSYHKALMSQGPFTIFVPVDMGFRNVFREHNTFVAFLANQERVRQIVRQHIIVGQLSLDDLQKHTDYYTLQGVSLTLSLRSRTDVFKYRLRGQSNKAKIIKGDLQCANGMIHVSNFLVTMEPDIAGDKQKTVLEMINQEGRYRRFQSHIQRLGMENLFEQSNVTVFVPNNRVWDELPEGTVDYLISPDGLPILRRIMENHIFPGVFSAEDLIIMKRKISLANSAVRISVTPLGLIQLNGEVDISQTDIVCSNGIYHHIEELLVPADMKDIVPKNCDVESFKVVRGSCDVCYGELRCPLPTDKPLDNITQGCRYWMNVQGHYMPHIGCARMCNRTYTRKMCCAGFFGEECHPCPGGFQDPCSGRGKCSDGRLGEGMCHCQPHFGGSSCQKCAEPDTFGINCTQRCSCLNGDCDDGPKGTGKCKSNTCVQGFVGDDCDRQLVRCGPSGLQLCHAFSKCYKDGDTFRCLCKPGYEGNGLSCQEIDPCKQPDRGGCHLQATCTKVGPDMPKCECNKDWVGDGFTCQPSNPCLLHADCGTNATCRMINIGEYHCMCNEGYFGNGSTCSPTNNCLHNNGGCHEKADCKMIGPGVNNCSCKSGYGGDGYNCYSSIAEEILNHPNLTRLAGMLKKLDSDENFLGQLSENYTFFAPSDDTLADYIETSKTDTYFDDPSNILTFLRFHTIEKAYTVYNLLQLSKVYPEFDTFYDGYSLRITGKNQSIHIFSSQTSTAEVTIANIPALNGYIHVVDRKAGLVSYLENMFQYTLLAPSNTALASRQATVTTRFLKYYILPNMVFTPSISDGQREITLLGKDFPLVFTVEDSLVYANGIPIAEPDHVTSGGVIQGLTQLLHPEVRRCDNKQVSIVQGPCDSCKANFSCPKGYDPVPGAGLIQNNCTFSVQKEDGKQSTYVGCYGMCQKIQMTPACCSGYFGAMCKECPGGPETPCNNKGQCSDSINGTGECSCKPGFRGDACESCVDLLAGPHCNVSINSCDYMNGNCSEHARCTELEGTILCRCNRGYVGDGHLCYSPCERSNGGCHEDAKCSYDYNSVNCTCYAGHHGDGHTCLQNVNLCAVDNGGCSPFAHCQFKPPKVTDVSNGTAVCQCLKGYVGNGSLCNKDVFDTLSYVGHGLRFFESLDNLGESGQSLVDLLKDRFGSVTVFVPLDESINDLGLLNFEDLSHHIVNNTKLYLNSSLASPLTLTSLSGQTLIIYRSNSTFQVNSITIVDPNIPTLNGYIHMIEHPLLPGHVPGEGTSKSAGGGVGKIVGPIVAVLLLIIIAVVIAVVVRRKSKSGFWDMWRKGSDSSLSFARLQAHHSDSDDDAFQQPDNVNFNNPLYSTTS